MTLPDFLKSKSEALKDTFNWDDMFGKNSKAEQAVQAFLSSSSLKEAYVLGLEVAKGATNSLYILEPGADDYEHERLVGRNAVLQELEDNLSALLKEVEV